MARQGRRSRPGRGGRFRPNRNAAKWPKMAAMIALPVGALGLGGVALNAYVGIEHADAAYCYERGDQYKSAIFVDNSFPVETAPQVRDYRMAFARMYEQAPPNAQLLFFATAADVQATLVKPVFTICKPPATLAEQDAIGAPEKPAPYLRRRASEAREAFDKAVDYMVADAQNPQKAAGDSPILEQIQAISRFAGFAGPARSLTVITDGIQNSMVARFCQKKGHMPPYATFAERPDYGVVAPDPFTGTTVSLLLVESVELPQPGFDYCTHAEMRAWWPDYFAANGAAEVELTVLRHWAGT